jgi:hypothetical protein
MIYTADAAHGGEYRIVKAPVRDLRQTTIRKVVGHSPKRHLQGCPVSQQLRHPLKIVTGEIFAVYALTPVLLAYLSVILPGWR